MDLCEVFVKRRIYRDNTDHEVSDEVLNKVIEAAFKASTNDHLQQMEFVVMRGRENIAKIVAPLDDGVEASTDFFFPLTESLLPSGLAVTAIISKGWNQLPLKAGSKCTYGKNSS